MQVFQACIGACRFDMQLALYLLPYLVQNVVSYGSDEARHGVQREVHHGCCCAAAAASSSARCSR